MNRFITALIAVFIIVFAHQSISQQPLLDPEMTVHDLFGMEPRNFREGILGRVVAAATVRLSRIEITEGFSTPAHNHPDEEIVLLLEGSIRAVSGDNEFVLQPGELILIPAYVEHHYVALEDSVTIEAFGPGRNLGAGGMGMGP